jgi:uncharacterized SAM-binding protein YcdF (DUF218 family)
MFFILSKLLYVFTEPIGWVILLLIYAIYNSRKKSSKIVLTLGLIITYLLSTFFVVDRLAAWWEIPVIDTKDLKKETWGIILSGGLINDEYSKPNHYYNGEESDRAYQAAMAFKAGKISKILISGGSLNSYPPIENHGAKAFLMQLGIPDSLIFQELKSRNTYENAMYSAQYFKEKNQKLSAVIFTNSWHMKRAAACYHKQGFQTQAFGSNPIGSKVPFSYWSFIPHKDAFKDMHDLTKEFVGFIIYALKDYI